MKILRFQVNLDKLGITASTLCAIHCAALPFFITMLPMWGLGFLANPIFEVLMIGVSLILGVWSLSSAYRKQHHQISPILVLILGFILIAFGHFAGIDALEPIFIPLGGFTIAAAHLINLRLLRKSRVNHQH